MKTVHKITIAILVFVEVYRIFWRKPKSSFAKGGFVPKNNNREWVQLPKDELVYVYQAGCVKK